jgi:hypothetical protein
LENSPKNSKKYQKLTRLLLRLQVIPHDLVLVAAVIVKVVVEHNVCIPLDAALEDVLLRLHIPLLVLVLVPVLVEVHVVVLLRHPHLLHGDVLDG